MILPPPRLNLFPYTTLFRSTGRLHIHKALRVAEEIMDYLRGAGDLEKVSFAGALRRAKETVGMVRLIAGSGSPSTVLQHLDRKSTRLNSSHTVISYAVFCLK